MSTLGVATAFKNIGKSDQVGVNIGIGIDCRMRDTSLSRKVNNVSEALICEQARDGVPIGKIAYREMEI